MKKVMLIYNPYSGEKAIVNKLDVVVEVHQKYGYFMELVRINKETNLNEIFREIQGVYEYILVAGGDGTVDSVVNAMKESGKEYTLGILPTGTANDFAKHIGIPSDIREACEKIINSEPCNVDLGKINNKYFVNVASTGLFTDISQKTGTNLKNTIGKLAYYLKGIEEIPNLRKLKIKVSWDGLVYNDYMYLMLIFNGRTAGNFDLAYKSQLSDGKLDVIIMKAENVRNMINIFFKILRTEHLENVEGILYFKTDKLYIECEEGIVTDIDGERGPDFPLQIECVKGALTIRGYEGQKVYVEKLEEV